MKDNYKKPTFHIWELLTKDFDLLDSSPEVDGTEIYGEDNDLV